MPRQTKPAADTAAAPPAARPDSQRSIHSVELGFRLIRCLEEASGPLSLKELSARAGMAAGKAHLYLVSFRRVGLVAQEPSGHYGLGPYALQLGLSQLRRLDAARLARPVLETLAAATGEAGYLAVWGNRGPCIIVKVDGARPIPMALQVGYVLPLVDTATGRVFLSHLPRPQTQAVLAEERARPAAGRQYDDAAVEAIVAETRSRGLSRTDGLLNIGFAALSAPVFGHDGELRGALTVIGPASGMDASFSGPCARRLVHAAGALSAQFGWERP